CASPGRALRISGRQMRSTLLVPWHDRPWPVRSRGASGSAGALVGGRPQTLSNTRLATALETSLRAGHLHPHGPVAAPARIALAVESHRLALPQRVEGSGSALHG